MKKNRKNSNGDRPIGKLTIIKDDLPSPKVLAKAFETKRITMDIENETLEFFRKQAETTGAKYQRLMREVLKSYANHHWRD